MRARTVLAALAATVATGATVTANAASIAIDGVTQRWPWNNKVDIAYTVEGGQDLAHKVYARIVFTATVDGTAYEIDGRAIGADASDGSHVATWNPPASLRVKTGDCAMTAKLLSAEAPSGDDYMVIDLATGAVTYEGLCATLDESLARYNTAVYKSDKMVLKKIPRWADHASLPNASSLPANGYPVGDGNWNSNKPVHYWQPKHDYYIGLFECTYAQYVKLGLTGGKSFSDSELTAGGRVTDTTLVPNVNCKWTDLRGGDVAPTAAVEPNAAGGFFGRLNARTLSASNLTGFDLPTEVMFEIALRAGTTSAYFWPSSSNGQGALEQASADYVVSAIPSVSTDKRPMEVGSKLPNGWGLYDLVGNVWELLRDDTSQSNLSLATSPFVPAYNDSADWGYKRYRSFRGGGYNFTVLQDFASSARLNRRTGFPSAYAEGAIKTSTYAHVGFRVAIVMD